MKLSLKFLIYLIVLAGAGWAFATFVLPKLTNQSKTGPKEPKFNDKHEENSKENSSSPIVGPIDDSTRDSMRRMFEEQKKRERKKTKELR